MRVAAQPGIDRHAYCHSPRDYPQFIYRRIIPPVQQSGSGPLGPAASAGRVGSYTDSTL